VTEDPAFDVNQIDELVHGPVRLGTLAYLSTAGTVEFQELKRRLATTDGNLASHLRKLEQAGYIGIAKEGAGRASVTRVAITPAGRRAFLAYLDTMTRLADEVRAQRSRRRSVTAGRAGPPRPPPATGSRSPSAGR
jgi:DNA-binding MarR family transcriptional regulator